MIELVTRARMRRYGAALAAGTGAAGLQFLIERWLGPGFAFAMPFLGVLVAARYGGFGPAVLATAIGGAFLYLPLAPPVPPEAERFQEASDLILYFLVAFGIAVLGGEAFRQRVVAESKAEQSGLMSDLIIEAAPGALIIVDPAGHMVRVNNRSEKFFGYTRDEMVGQPVDMLVPEAARWRHANQRHSYAASPTTRQMAERTDLLGQRKDGSTFPVEIGLAPLQVGHDRLVVASVVDISWRKDLERSIAGTHESYRLLLDSLTEHAIYMLSPEGLIVNWNKGAERLTGYPAREVVGSHFERFFTEEDRRRNAPAIHLAMAVAKGRLEAEGQRLRRDGSVFQANAVIEPVRDPAGTVIGFVKVTRDVTARNNAEAEIRQSQKMLAVGQLTGGVAHDFNNILMVILGGIDELREGPGLTARMRESLDQIATAVDRAAELTRGLLAFSRKQPLRPQPTDINDLVVAIGGLLRRTLGERIELQSILADGLSLVEIDRTQLETALINLCVNARDAMPSGGRLLIETQNVALDEDYVAKRPDISPGAYVMLAVTDSGVGIPPEQVDKVFEPFFTTKEVGKGTGLGLSMVYGFVKQSNGHIRIYSELGRGTVVRMYLPAGAKVRPENGQTAAQVRAVPRGSQRILVVEDDAQVRRSVVGQLRGLGYEIVEAADGAAGLAACEASTKPYDLVLTDVVMPGAVGGEALAEEVRRRWPGTRILFMSGYTENALMYQGHLDAGVDLLTKPFRKDDLAEAIRRILSAPRS